MIMNRQNVANTDVLSDIINLLKAQIPFEFTEFKRATFLRRIKRRMYRHSLGWLYEYYTFLQHHPEEVEILVRDFSQSLTTFFRDAKAFEYLKNNILNQIVYDNTNDIKIWIAGCATGEEAYSIAILFKEYLEAENIQRDIKIYATDINRFALEFASLGKFSENIKYHLSKGRLEKFFIKLDHGYQIKSEIKELILFEEHDLSKNKPYEQVDLITCRNLLSQIEDKYVQKKIISSIQFGLKGNGYLFLGSTDNLSLLEDDFVIVDERFKVCKSKDQHLVDHEILEIQQPDQSFLDKEPLRTTIEISEKESYYKKEIARLSNDLNNYFRSNFNLQLFVGKDFLLRKVISGAFSDNHIQRSYIGESILDIDIGLDFQSFVEDIYKVLSSKEVAVKEVKFDYDQFYQILIVPYLREEDLSIDGVIITFNNITTLKLLQEDLHKSNEQLLYVTSNLNKFIYSALHELTIPILNIELALNMLNNKIDSPDPDNKKYLKVINNSVLTFKNILKDLPTVSKY
jgi:chemotaxis methyl-accepting protein methylase